MIHPLNPLQRHLSCSSMTSARTLFIGETFKSNSNRRRDCTAKFKAGVEDLENIYKTEPYIFNLTRAENIRIYFESPPRLPSITQLLMFDARPINFNKSTGVFLFPRLKHLLCYYRVNPRLYGMRNEESCFKSVK